MRFQSRRFCKPGGPCASIDFGALFELSSLPATKREMSGISLGSTRSVHKETYCFCLKSTKKLVVNLARCQLLSWRRENGDFQEIRPVLFRRAAIARSVTQKPFCHWSLALSGLFGYLCYHSDNWDTIPNEN